MASEISPTDQEYRGNGRIELPPDVIPADTVLVVETGFRYAFGAPQSAYERGRGRRVNLLNGGSPWPELHPPHTWNITDMAVTALKPGQFTIAHYESNAVLDSNPQSSRIVINKDSKAKKYLNHALRRAWVYKKGFEYVEPDRAPGLVKINPDQHLSFL